MKIFGKSKKSLIKRSSGKIKLMELQLIGLTIDFLGTILLLLFLDPVIMDEKIHNEQEISKEEVLKRYLMKRYFALIVIILGFILQVVSFFHK